MRGGAPHPRGLPWNARCQERQGRKVNFGEKQRSTPRLYLLCDIECLYLNALLVFSPRGPDASSLLPLKFSTESERKKRIESAFSIGFARGPRPGALPRPHARPGARARERARDAAPRAAPPAVGGTSTRRRAAARRRGRVARRGPHRPRAVRGHAFRCPPQRLISAEPRCIWSTVLSTLHQTLETP